MAKLTRWGVDFHMGILFGVLNQGLLIVFGAGLCLMIALGYRLWWIRRPAGPAVNPVQTLVQCWLMLNGKGRCAVLVVVGVLGMAMPVAGVSLLLFMMIDWLRWYKMSQNLLAQSAG